jgi:hypothetical protein
VLGLLLALLTLLLLLLPPPVLETVSALSRSWLRPGPVI